MDERQITAILDAETARLTAARAAARHEYDQLQDGSPTDPVVDAGLLEREIDASLLDQIDGELAALAGARGRLAAGSYGLCIVCQSQIGDERLAAVPWTERCHDHQAAAEVLLESRYVEGTNTPPSAAETARTEAEQHLDLIRDDDDRPFADDRDDVGAEDAAIHITRP